MAKIFAFNGYRYDKRKISLDRVLTSPFVYIKPSDRKSYYEKDPHNFIRLLDGETESGDSEEQNRYMRAGEFLGNCINKTIIAQDKLPSIYAYRQEYSIGTEARKITKNGFIALARLDEVKETLPEVDKNKMHLIADRFALLSTTQCNLEPLQLLYSDASKSIDSIINEAIQKNKPDSTSRDENGNMHHIWAISEDEAIRKIKREMGTKKIFLAKNFIECEAALRYRHLMATKGINCEGDEHYDNYLALFSNMDDDGLCIHTHHRLISGIAEFNVKKIEAKFAEHFKLKTFDFANEQEEKNARESLMKELTFSSAGHHFGMAMRNVNKYYLLSLRKKDTELQSMMPGVSEQFQRLDVTIVEKFVLDTLLGIDISDGSVKSTVHHCEDSNRAFADILEKKYQMAFFLNPPKPKQLKEFAGNRIELPAGTAEFYPRPLAGLVFSKINVAKG